MQYEYEGRFIEQGIVMKRRHTGTICVGVSKPNQYELTIKPLVRI